MGTFPNNGRKCIAKRGWRRSCAVDDPGQGRGARDEGQDRCQICYHRVRIQPIFYLSLATKEGSFSVVGVPPRIMGIGPRYAIPAVLKHAGIDINDVDLFEVSFPSPVHSSFPLHSMTRPAVSDQ